MHGWTAGCNEYDSQQLCTVICHVYAWTTCCHERMHNSSQQHPHEIQDASFKVQPLCFFFLSFRTLTRSPMHMYFHCSFPSYVFIKKVGSVTR